MVLEFIFIFIIIVCYIYIISNIDSLVAMVSAPVSVNGTIMEYGGSAMRMGVGNKVAVSVERPYFFGLFELPVYYGQFDLGLVHNTFFTLFIVLTTYFVVQNIKTFSKKIKEEKL